MKYSKFGKRFTRPSGITQLMIDLGKANASDDPDIIMLGGGNPALIPEAQAVFSDEANKLLKDSKQFDSMLSAYDGPQGNEEFLSALTNMLNEHFGWGISTANIALTNGSQNSFFYLFNLLAGEMEDGSNKKVLLPLAPEYVGYADLGLSDDMFKSLMPKIEMLENNQFKYHVDFDALTIDEDIAAICVSRPTNPTGNVITDTEMAKLDKLAKQNDIPLIIDNAYGLPFPGAIYTDAEPFWNQNTIMCMSLSKLGLPGARTGIVIAREEIVQAISSLSAIMTLAPNSLGAALMTRLIKNNKLMNLRDNIVKPFYQQKAEQAIELFNEIFQNLPVYLHKPEGAFFMWLWFEELSFGCEELYKRLKKRNVYVIPGHNFFINIKEKTPHMQQCVRINYAKDYELLKKGLEIIAEEIQKK